MNLPLRLFCPLVLLLALGGCNTTTTPSAAPSDAVSINRPVQPQQDPYMLQHRIIPRILFNSDGQFFAKLHAGEFDTFRAAVAKTNGQAYADGLRFKTTENPDIVFITFPDPARMPLCYHAAMIRTADGFRYLTLERTEDILSQGFLTALCEWTPDGGHHNYGPRTYASLMSFEQEVRSILKP